jgi:hypothetical protein
MDWFQKRESTRHFSGKLKQVFSYLMVLIYIGFGLFFIVKGWPTLTKTQSYSIGILLLLYSIFRTIRIVKDAKTKDTDDELSEE